MSKRPADWLPDWGRSQAKKALVTDLRTGVIPLDMQPDEAWAFYSNDSKFRNVPMAQFKDQFQHHVRQVCDQLDKDNNWIEWTGRYSFTVIPSPMKISLGRLINASAMVSSCEL